MKIVGRITPAVVWRNVRGSYKLMQCPNRCHVVTKILFRLQLTLTSASLLDRLWTRVTG